MREYDVYGIRIVIQDDEALKDPRTAARFLARLGKIIKSDQVVKCPKCGRIQADLEWRDGKLMTEGGAQLTGFVCVECGRVVHNGQR